jgi:HAD superfamily, subfamily IIIB (Acid phosphatase)
MTHQSGRLRRHRPSVLSTALLAAVSLAGVTVLVAAGPADAGRPGIAPAVTTPTSPTSASQLMNLDQVKSAIKVYYGDTAISGTDPVTLLPTTLHVASPTSAYANEVAGIEARATGFLAARATHKAAMKAIVLDVDDTTLSTYEYEIYSGFAYNPTTNAAFVNGAVFPAVFGMPALASTAQAEGYTVFFLTGRPITQSAGTITNLTNDGYPVVPSQVYLKDNTASWLVSCAPTCTTTQYKSLTRQHIESLGYDIVANLGDQFSDLNGGFADNTFKMPNPMYFLP